MMGSAVDIGNEMAMCEELMAEADAEGRSDSSDDEFAKALAANRPRNVPREGTGGGTRGKSFRGGKRLRARHMEKASAALGWNITDAQGKNVFAKR